VNSFKAFLNFINENQPNDSKQYSSSKDPYITLRRCIFSLPPCSSVYNKYENSRLENRFAKQCYLTEQTDSNKLNQDFASVFSKSNYQISLERFENIYYNEVRLQKLQNIFFTDEFSEFSKNIPDYIQASIV
jgi:hypothetical protein